MELQTTSQNKLPTAIFRRLMIIPADTTYYLQARSTIKEAAGICFQEGIELTVGKRKTDKLIYQSNCLCLGTATTTPMNLILH